MNTTATVTTSTGTELVVSKTIRSKATHVIVASTTASWDRMEQMGAKVAADRKKDMARFGTPVNGEYVYGRASSEKAALAAARKAEQRGETVEVIAL